MLQSTSRQLLGLAPAAPVTGGGSAATAAGGGIGGTGIVRKHHTRPEP
jgi:hypothetical protein